MIHIATAANENFAPGLLVTIASALTSLDQSSSVTIYFLNGGISEGTKKQLLKLCETLHPDCRLVDLPINEGPFSGANLGPGNSLMTYARLLLGSLIPSERVIYIDADFVVLRDLAEMWRMDMNGKTILAVADRAGWTLSRDCPLELTEDDKAIPYFNAGYLMIDLKRWRELSIEQNSLSMATRYHCVYWDQTVLNYLFRFDRKLVESCWNWQDHNILDGPKAVDANYHLTDNFKPWLYWGSNLKHQIWRLYYGRYVGSLLMIYVSKVGFRAIFLGIKERVIRYVPVLRRFYFSYLKRKDSGRGEIEGVIKFYENSSLMVPQAFQSRAYRAFRQSHENIKLYLS
jgi:lipopolysaccharide biosynthesis glycosyltransferase